MAERPATPRPAPGLRRPIVPAAASIGALLLFVAGLAVASFNEAAFRAQATREARVQAQMLAASVTAALAFSDTAAAREYVGALRANPEIEAGGVYDAMGALVAGYGAADGGAPARAPPLQASDNGVSIQVATPVTLNTQQIGTVYIRTASEPFYRTANRYAAIGILGLMASLIVAALAAANAAQRAAFAALKDEIAQRERAEDALRQSQKMEAMGQLTGGVAHDFNNLLMVASSGLDLLDRTQEPQRRERLKQGVRQAIDRGASLTRQLLAFSRRTPLTSQVVDLGAQVDGMRMLLDRSLREDIAVRLEVEPGLWLVEIDPGALEVALVNIALNARDAMPHGGVIGIRVRNRPDLREPELEGDFVELAVSDTGEGMAAELAARIFEPFFTTKVVGKGTGLGLAQVYGFARSSGGGVAVDSRPGAGTTISMFFPRSTASPPAPLAAAPNPEPVTPRALRKLSVLLVEDDDGVAIAVADMLHALGHDSRRAASAEGALGVLDHGRKGFDLVLSDMVMPGEMDGIGLAREIRARWPDLPIVLSTGYSEAADEAIREGLTPLAKPYTIEQLAARLEEAAPAP